MSLIALQQLFEIEVFRVVRAGLVTNKRRR
jgi:hypothetical protein